MPALRAVDLEGHAWRLDDLRGRAVLLNFWTSGCRPCRAEMPMLQDLAAIYGPARLAVLTIDCREPPKVVARYVDASHLVCRCCSIRTASWRVNRARAGFRPRC